MIRLALHPALAQALHGARVPILLTGTGGWLGQAMLEMLDGVFEEALPARVIAFSTAPEPLRLRSGRIFTPLAFAELENYRLPSSLIFHFAFLTRGHAQAPDYIAINRGISQTLQAFIARNGTAGIFIPSSGAAYAPDLAQNPYGALKLEDEQVFSALAWRLGFPAAIIRIFNLAGPFINNPRGYALASIILDLLAGAPVRLTAARPVLRSYTHVGDVLNIAAALLLHRLDVPVFDTAGEQDIEIGALATRAGKLLGAAEVSILRPAWENAEPDHYVGNFAAYQNAARLAGVELLGLDRQILDTAAYMADMPPSS